MSNKKINPGLSFRFSQEGSGGSETWSSVASGHLVVAPTISYQATSVVELFASAGAAYRFRENIVSISFRNPAGKTNPWDTRLSLGLRGHLGNFQVELAAERGLADRGGSILVEDPADRVYAPGYYATNLRFGIGFTFGG